LSEVPHAGDDRVVPIDPDVDRSDRPRASRAQPRVLCAIAAGGALGAPARYEVAQIIHVAKDTFPWATFWTNVSGSFALGFLLILIIERFPPTRYLHPFFATGFLGAFTTFSTFAVETDLLVKDGHAGIGIVYALASLATGFAAVWAGILLARLGRERKTVAT
jgi:CrcB protein